MDIIDKYDYIVNSKTGIVKNVSRKVNDVIPEFIHYVGVINNPKLLADNEDRNKRYTVVCGGTSFDETVALSKCLGECLERYAALNINYDNLIQGSYNQLTEQGYKCTHIKEFSFFSEEQLQQKDFPFKRINKNTTLYWIWCKNLFNNDDVLVPAELVYLNHVEKFSINYNISTGQACGETLEDAILTAIYEVIERDSFIMTWKKKISFPHIDISTIDDDVISNMLEKFFKSNMEVWLIKAEMEYGIPTIIGVLYNRNSNYKNILIDSSTKSTYRKAIISVLDSLANLVMINLKNYNRFNGDTNYNTINELHERIKIFMSSNVWDEANFLIAGDKIKYKDLKLRYEENNNKSNKKLIDECVEKLNMHGITSYYCDITTRDVKHLGFNIVQAIIPDLLSLDISSNYMYLGGRRLFQANELFSNYKHISGINYFPHPFL
ncbi:YcaO-like family protein [Sedimentibacter sp. MB35-C1]|uniref:YcaO-like family protein n=1 Tax=Sedimentibacter sp. MB35-C1 TaxID=3070995 RepID=UPI0027DF4BCD|nr:YcaO-like family protein [Sedimentibacter sp. MB35-C1]WMJ77205.1 YcaO-like family protein [Sedimentibacter sp. MB35-C1]